MLQVIGIKPKANPAVLMMGNTVYTVTQSLNNGDATTF